MALRSLRYLVVLLALTFFLFPIYWMLIASIKLPADILHIPPVWFPAHPTLIHFATVMQLKGGAALRNSLVIASSATLLALLLGGLAAYSLARFNTGGRHLAFWIFSQRLMPPIVVVIPIFLVFRVFGLLDTYVGLIVLYAFFNLPYVIWMLRSYFAEVPVEIEESALVDGCTRLGVLRWVTLPLTLPGLIATATFAFIFSWTEFLFALILTRSTTYTLPVIIAGYLGGQGALVGQAAALSAIATLPIVVLGLLVHKHFARGLTLGAVKS